MMLVNSECSKCAPRSSLVPNRTCVPSSGMLCGPWQCRLVITCAEESRQIMLISSGSVLQEMQATFGRGAMCASH